VVNGRDLATDAVNSVIWKILEKPLPAAEFVCRCRLGFRIAIRRIGVAQTGCD